MESPHYITDGGIADKRGGDRRIGERRRIYGRIGEATLAGEPHW